MTPARMAWTAACASACLFPAAAWCGPQTADPAGLAAQVEVVRTEFGVPHIYAENFRALGYALGYLQLEDYGERVPQGMARNRGDLARHIGASALDSDFENRPRHDIAVAAYPRLGEDTRAVYEGFAEGVNRYIALHPDEFPEWMRPDFDGRDVAALYVYTPSSAVMNRWRRRLDGPDAGDVEADASRDGSSAWALAPGRTESRAAILMRNPHLSWGAGYWEAHAVVPGRLDFYGDFRIGGPLGIIGGFNRNLGFATTNNDVDRDEVYALRADPDRPDAYVLDGESHPVRREPRTVEYRDGAAFAEETRERLVTDLGPVVHRTDERIYVLRTPDDGEFRAGEQFLRLMQAANLDEWTEAMRLRAHPGSNFVYADADGNIFYIWNAAIPVRPHPAGGDRPVPVRRMEQVWTELHRLEDLPQLLNPPGGYVRNENDGPWLTNLERPLDPADYPDYFENHELGLRSQHSLRLVGNGDRLSLEDVVRLKHSDRVLLADRVKDDLTGAVRAALAGRRIANTAAAPTAAALLLLERWDNRAAADSRGAVLFSEWWRAYSGRFPGDAEPFAESWTESAPMETPRGLADADLAVALFADAVGTTIERFGAFDVEWGAVHRVRRGGVDAPVGGCAGAMGCFRVLNFEPDADGRRAVDGGDGWVLAVEFTDPPRAYSVLGYGQSAKPDSPHFADQADMFARGEMKPVRFTPDDVERHAVRRYRPGLEPTSGP